MAAKGGAAPEQSEPKDEGKLWGEILSANGSVVVWLVFLAFGGALLSLYHSKIQYFPDLRWEDSLTYLAALSLLGGGIAVIYGLLLFIPGALWSELLIHDTELEDKLCYDGRRAEPCFWNVLAHMGIPFLIFMCVMHFIELRGDPWWTAAWAVFLLILISFFLWKRFGSHLESKDGRSRTNVPECLWVREERQGIWVRQVRQAEVKGTQLFRRIFSAISFWWTHVGGGEPGSKKSLLFKYVFGFDLSALASLISLLFIYAIVDVKTSPLLAVICTGLVTLSNFFVAVQFRNRPGRAALTALLATLVLLACSEIVDGGKAALSTGIMKKFGVGAEASLVTLVVDPKAQAVQTVFEGLGSIRQDPPRGVIPDVLILSRLGKEYCLDVMKREWVKYEVVRYEEVKKGMPRKRVVMEHGEKERLVRQKRVVIPRQHVLSWSVQPPLEIRVDRAAP